MSATARMPPPHRVHYTTGLSPDGACTRLSTYLTAAEQQPHLHPDARLTVSGVEFNTAGPVGGVVLHNLRRLQAGLRGELLLPEPEPEPEADVEMQDAEGAVPEGDDARLDAAIVERTREAAEDDAQDEEAEETAPAAHEAAPVDKEQRKKDKKARRKAEKAGKAQSTDDRNDAQEKKRKKKGKKDAST